MWATIWWRRVAYFATLSATIWLALFPAFQSIWQSILQRLPDSAQAVRGMDIFNSDDIVRC
jgi:hypothetical protein